MPAKGHGRPKGTEYDHLMLGLVDAIYASGGTKTLNQAMREQFPEGFKFGSASPPTAEKRFRKLWKEGKDVLLAEAAAREQKRKANDPKVVLDRMLMMEALKLKELAQGKAPYPESSAFGIKFFLERATPEDFKRNPMVPIVMSFGEFQIAHERRGVIAKLKGDNPT
ncbi:hypothetical protein FY136_28720 (plasmid) [Agrobacterium tumefaciens]|uniref:hypothetical protein n=1 Tax=Agrobacterium tumefaciens TaxID=358 RepID=UPI0021CF9979|nr:hypothetical protein [Agrobacterium tumefaciens]UXT53247.1 hypothetical protein FY136_28720 [Agrobacterium tumefaciens]